MRDLDDLFTALAESSFRSRFALNQQHREYVRQKTLPVVLQHARRFVLERLAPAEPRNDGRQTPMKGHPAFAAQHATATCCRSCLAKWHYIEQGRLLSPEQIEYVVEVIQRWLRMQQSVEGHDPEP